MNAPSERAAVVAAEKRIADWLRSYGNIRCGGKMLISAMRDAGPEFADAIERGEHRKDEGHHDRG